MLSSFRDNASNLSDTKLDEMAKTTKAYLDIEAASSTRPATISKGTFPANHLRLLFRQSSTTAGDTLTVPSLPRKCASAEPISPLGNMSSQSTEFKFDISKQNTRQIAATLNGIEKGLSWCLFTPCASH